LSLLLFVPLLLMLLLLGFLLLPRLLLLLIFLLLLAFLALRVRLLITLLTLALALSVRLRVTLLAFALALLLAILLLLLLTAAGLLSLLTFAREHTADTYLLLGMRLEDLTDGPADLGAVNDPVVKTLGELAARLDGPATHERAVLATVDLPYGAIRRRLLGGKPPPPALDGPVAAAVRAVLQGASA